MRARTCWCTALLLFALTASAAEPLRIVTIMTRSGTLATGLRPSKTAESARMAVEEINLAGGLLGRRVELVELDSQSSALHARAAAQEAIKLHPLGVVGDNKSSLSLAMAPLLQQAHVLMLSPNSTHVDLTKIGDYIFRLSFSDDAQALALSDFARRDLKAATVAVLTNVSVKYSEELARQFSTQFTKRGGRIAFNGEYVQDTSDFGPMLAKLKAANPDLIFLPGYAKDAGVVMRQARELGIKAHFLGGDGWGARAFDYGGEAVIGSYHVVHWHRDDPRAISRDFVRRFEGRNGAITSDSEVLVYDAVHVLADAVRRANSTEPAQIRAALAKTRDLPAAAGTVSFDAGRNAIKPLVIVRHDAKQLSLVRAVSAAGEGR